MKVELLDKINQNNKFKHNLKYKNNQKNIVKKIGLLKILKMKD